MTRGRLIISAQRKSDWDTIDWTYEEEAHIQYKADRRNNAEGASEFGKWTFKARENLMGWIPVLIVGGVTGVLAGMIDIASQFLGTWRFGMCRSMPWLARDMCCPGATPCDDWVPWSSSMISWVPYPEFTAYVTISVFYGVLCAWLVITYSPYAAGSGIPEIKTILSGIHIKRYLGFWTLFIKCIGLSLSVGSGLSLGKEGPFVHVSTCVGNLISNLFMKYKHHESKKREMLSASCAAGVAVAFGAPIGGVLFSLEEASYYFPHKTMWRAFFCAVVAALVLKSIDPSNLGSLVMFKVDYNHPWHWFELVPHALMGIIGGVIGAVFNSMNTRWIRYKRATGISEYALTEAFLVTLITAVCNFSIPYLKGSSTEFLSQIFRECRPDETDGLCEYGSEELPTNLLIAGMTKLVLTIFTFGIKVPAGLFVPSLFVGACTGRLLGMWVKAIYSQYQFSYLFTECAGQPHATCIIPGIYAIVGAASVLGGVTRMTLSLVVIVFELTGGLEYLVPVMLAVIISKWVGEWVGGRQSIYELHILMNGYPYLDPKIELRSTDTVADLMEAQDLKTVAATGWKISDVQDLLESCDYKGFPVVNTADKIVGWILRKNLTQAIETARGQHLNISETTGIVLLDGYVNHGEADVVDASWFVDSTPMQISKGTSVNRLLQLFKSLGLRSILVAHHSTLQGIITRKDVLEYVARYELHEDTSSTFAVSPREAEQVHGHGEQAGVERFQAPPLNVVSPTLTREASARRITSGMQNAPKPKRPGKVIKMEGDR
eukprot:TRINITY_DN27074_c0_g1_i1.p1 TRINITY_DN27074_c0_g1~~TRINITY_DN27074_c0_g1_i1.p1  ORF type:complete len:775 (+),score=87.74 TRINITY_DN27074_c0_g1_i1:74-2398(+)